MKTNGPMLAGFLILGVAGSGLHADDASTEQLIKQLQKRIEELELKVQALEGTNKPTVSTKDGQSKERMEELEQKVKVLERNRELDQEAAEAKAKEAPKITVGDQGFSLASANGNFALQLKGVLQVDSRTYFNDHGTVGNDGFILRRVRPVLQGTVFRDFDFLFVPDFGTANNGGNGGNAPTPQIQDAYLNYRYNNALQIQGGKFKAPIGLEQLQADRDVNFNERALPTDLVANRDLGFELHGDLFKGVASYAAGIFNGAGDARNSSLSAYQDNKAFEGRLFFQPFKTTSLSALQGFGLGVAGSYQKDQGTNTLSLPSNNGYATVGQQLFFAYNPTNRSVLADGEHWRLSPQGYYYYGPFGLLGEYVISDQKVSLAGAGLKTSAFLEHTAWQVAGSWVMTGEDATYGSVVPRRAFDPRNGGWGAWQLVARYSELNIDDATFPLFSNPLTSAHAAKEWSVGLNWYLNRNIKVSTSFSHTDFQGGGGKGSSPPASVTRQDENVLFTRVQLAF
ncbi:MAG TPA: porin [Candidatus Limnocylindrales bacterium]|jgi:phosphate-selective porin OprO/OprP|nr:porin [Candidatus Limnocylindrales bacterium]